MGDTRINRSFVCSDCGFTFEGFFSPKKSRCKECSKKKLAAYLKEYTKKNREKLNQKNTEEFAAKSAAGFCTSCAWGVPASPGHTLCEKHLQKRREVSLKHRIARKESGVCTTCGDVAVPGKISCERCLIRACQGTRRRSEEGKRKIVAYLGGKCQRCGLVTDIMPVYEIHHLTKKNKEFNMKTIQGWSWESVQKELDKGVQLLCANCHRIIQYAHEENWANRGQ